MHNNRSNTNWSPRIILQQKSPVMYLVRVGQRIRYCHADHLLHNGEVNIPSQVDDDIIDASSENNETLSSEAALAEELEINQEHLWHSSRKKRPLYSD